MLAGFLLALREGMEAALIVGIVLSVLRKTDRQNFNSAVWLGAFVAIVVSVMTALGLSWIGAEFEGKGEQVFEGFTMFLAAGVLTWMVFWTRKRSHSMSTEIEKGLDQATHGHGQRALFFLAFLAVVREGIELALFLLAVHLSSTPFQELIGVALGISLAALLGWVIFTSSHRLSLSRFFQSTNVLLALFAAGLVGLATGELNELGWIPTIIEHVWSLNGIIPDGSASGQMLKSLVGYSSSPSLTQVIAYCGYFAILAGIWIANHKTKLAHKFQVE